MAANLSSSSPLLTFTSLLFLILSSNSYFLATTSAITTKTTTELHDHQSSSNQPFKYIYAFGDSYTDTGNTNSSTGPNAFMSVSRPPYGQTYFHHPTNRYSDGRLVIDFVAQKLSLPFLPPYLSKTADKSSGVNFAVAGSTAIIHSFFAKNNLTLDITPQSLLTQLAWFNSVLESKGCKDKSATPKECKAVFDDSLIWVGEIGANDYAYILGSTVSKATVQKLAIGSVTRFLEAIMNKGAKYVVVQGLPSTGCLTLAMALAAETDRDSFGCVKTSNDQSYNHNAILQSKLNDFRKRFPGAVIVYADYWNAYMTVVKNPKKYGITELFKACCGYSSAPYNFDVFNTCGTTMATSCKNPSEYVNWDGVHLTEAMYKAVSEEILDGSFCQPSFEYLLSMKRKSG
ncbi:OLC1v1013508C1 [Oldenlandia corymbosa var. corymbosa]|uniref:OLC1v1013508C1 n=1 Tax=Oldenlandia corymbosa var. corymbosa TaxID=529605 RepID=A0AAV1DYX0_OLDCO|nr:OLC1v1013508C1 [Oldenlandia corymbosa var. corymbosa]